MADTIHTVDPNRYTIRRSWAAYEQRAIFYIYHPDLSQGVVAQFWSKREAQAWVDKKKKAHSALSEKELLKRLNAALKG